MLRVKILSSRSSSTHRSMYIARLANLEGNAYSVVGVDRKIIVPSRVSQSYKKKIEVNNKRLHE